MTKLDYPFIWHQADLLKQAFLSAKPFPFVVLDDFIPEGMLRDLLDEFPSVDSDYWKRPSNAHTQGKQVAASSIKDLTFGPQTREWLHELHSAPFLEFLTRLTGIDGLIGDPWLAEGGFHQVLRDGYLDIHADFSKHDRLNLERRVNLLCYLNEGWVEDFGGHISLFDMKLNEVRRILPTARRCVIFETSQTSFHGHPTPLTCPDSVTRKSFALYYYSATRPVAQEPHRIIFPTDKEFAWKETCPTCV